MRALDADVLDAVWAATEPLLPVPPEHPLGCHRPRVPDRLCLWALLIRLTTGSSWVDIEAILDHQVSDTTLRARRDEWIAAGVFEQLRTEALAAFDRIVGLDLSDVALDGSLHSAARWTGGSRDGERSGTWRAGDVVVERRRRLVLWSWSRAPQAGDSRAPSSYRVEPTVVPLDHRGGVADLSPR
jgi:transposase